MFLKLLFASLASHMIIFRLNITLFLKIKNSYMFRLAKVAIIRLNMKKEKRGFIVTINSSRFHTTKVILYYVYKHVKNMQLEA